MNMRQKKKAETMKRNKERKQLKEFIMTIKRLSEKLNYGAPPEPVMDEMKETVRTLVDKTSPNGFSCSDVLLDYHDNVVRGNIVLAPTMVPIDLKVVKNRI
jgi:hypothetical protein